MAKQINKQTSMVASTVTPASRSWQQVVDPGANSPETWQKWCRFLLSPCRRRVLSLPLEHRTTDSCGITFVQVRRRCAQQVKAMIFFCFFVSGFASCLANQRLESRRLPGGARAKREPGVFFVQRDILKRYATLRRSYKCSHFHCTAELIVVVLS